MESVPSSEVMERAREAAANLHTAVIYAATISGLIAFFTIIHYGRQVLHLQHHQRGTLAKVMVAPFRAFRTVFLRKLPKFTSGGHFLLILSYVGLNAIFMFWDMSFSDGYSFFAKRAGWLTITNSSLAFLLAMKNTPLAFLTGYSHERLNVLHRWTGRTIWVFACLHVLTYSIVFAQSGAVEEFTQRQQIFGFVAFAAFNVIVATSLQFFRRRFYEFFYIIHTLMFMTAVIFLGLHHPEKFAKAIGAVGSFWIFDRLVRTARMLYYSYGNTVTVVPLPGMATKVIFKRKIHCTPGSHAFISIPSIRKLQSHPFTISSASGTEFVIKAQKAFTLDLHKYALKYPYGQLNAFIDGPYGAAPDFKRMNKVVLFAGGTGGAFSFPIAIDIVRNADRCAVTHVEFVWVIRDERNLVWYEEDIHELRKSPIVNLSIYVTSKNDSIVAREPAEIEATREEDFRRSLYAEDGDGSSSSAPSISASESYGENSAPATPTTDLEKKPTTARRSSRIMEEQIDQGVSIPIETLGGRPDLSSIVKTVCKDAEQRDTVAVGACGPTELMRVARNAVAESIRITGPSISLHCEQFGWG